MLFDEPVDFDSINHDHLKSLMASAGLTKYLMSIRQTKIQKEELAQFYAQLTVTRHPKLVLHSVVNNIEFNFNEDQLSAQFGLHSSGVYIQDCETFEQLPFHLDQEIIWNAIGYGFDPRN